MPRSIRLTPLLAAWLALAPAAASAQAFVEYPAHPATYGDHVIAATWIGGPTTVSVAFESDEAILHDDSQGQSQRTARNTLNFVAPSEPANPQNYDDTQLVARYGARLPLLQQMSANGASVLRYAFTSAIATGFDLFVTDVDSNDSASVRAYGTAGKSLDMAAWTLVASGDLSLYKDTGTEFSSIVAPLPVTTFAGDAIALVAADGSNYNRSYAVLRAPAGVAVGSVEVGFRGTQNSASRADAGTGAHVYVAISTTPGATDAPPLAPGRTLALSVESPARGVARVRYTLAARGDARLSLHDASGRRVWQGRDAQGAPGVRDLAIPLVDRSGRALPPGVYLVQVQAGRESATRRLAVLR